MILRRLRRVAGPRCLARDCPLPKVHGLSKWCRDHTDAILVGQTIRVGRRRSAFCEHDEYVLAAARRLGARRWFLLAEVALEQERQHVRVIAECAAQSEAERAFNRTMWVYTAPLLVPPVEERVDELVGLGCRSPAAEGVSSAANEKEGRTVDPE